MIRTADGKVVAIDGREMAPEAATRVEFIGRDVMIFNKPGE